MIFLNSCLKYYRAAIQYIHALTFDLFKDCIGDFYYQLATENLVVDENFAR